MDPSVSGFFHCFVRSICVVCGCGSFILIAVKHFSVDEYLSNFYYESASVNFLAHVFW